MVLEFLMWGERNMKTILKLVMVAKRIKKMMNWPMIEMRNKTILKDVIMVCEIFVEECELPIFNCI